MTAAPANPKPLGSYADVFLIAACFGLFSGLLEGGVYWLLSLRADGYGWRNDLLPQILWIVPLTDVLLFLIVALLLVAVCHFFWRNLRKDLFAYVVFAALAIYGPFSAPQKLHFATAALITAGVTVQTFRFFRARRPLKTASLVWGLAGLSALVTIVSLAGAGLKTQRSVHAQTTPSASKGKPNVLLITLDTLRADHLTSYGYPKPTTPSLDLLAHDGMLFENAFSGASWTLPSHATLMTGRAVHEHQAGAGPLGTEYPTLAEYLASKGYATAGFVANTYYTGAKTGLNRGFRTYEDYFSNPVDMAGRTFYGSKLFDELPRLGYYDIPGRKHAAAVNEEFLNWLKQSRPEPFFAFLNYLDVHDPYIPPAASHASSGPQPGEQINSELFPRDFVGGHQLSEQELAAEIQGYDDSLAYLDSELGSLVASLKSMGLLDNTLVIVTSDHGESFGNHGLYGHGNSLYNDLLHVPLIIRYPSGVSAGTRVREAVSLQAVPATVVAVLGFDAGTPFKGPDLTHCCSQPDKPDSFDSASAFAESLPGIVKNRAYPLGRRSAMKSLSTSQWHLILYEEGKVELYRVDQDPQEANNLAKSSQGQEAIRRFGPRLSELLSPEDWKIFGPLVTP